MPAAGVLGGPFWVEVASGWEWVTRRIRLQKLYQVVVVVWRVVTRAPGNLISINTHLPAPPEITLLCWHFH